MAREEDGEVGAAETVVYYCWAGVFLDVGEGVCEETGVGKSEVGFGEVWEGGGCRHVRITDRILRFFE